MAEQVAEASAVETPQVQPSSSEPIAFDTADLGLAAQAPAVPGAIDAQEYGFDDENVKQYEFDLYKGRKGITDRIGILAPPLGIRAHFKQGIGYFKCLSVYERRIVGGQSIESCKKYAACCQHSDAARKRFIVPLIQYSTNPNGQLMPGNFSYALKAWVYTDDKFIQMRTIHGEFPLTDHDLLVTCTEENYQKLTMAACREALWKNPKLPQQIRDEIKSWTDVMRPKMSKLLGKTLTEQQFLEKAGLAAPAASIPGADAPIVDLKGLLDGPG